ncbi:MAG: hypothetical protein ACOYLQ_01155 [Hyphomicrobiaceae bacterium]
MNLIKTTMLAMSAMTVALGASGAVATAEAKVYKKHGHVVIVTPHIYRHSYAYSYGYPYYSRYVSFAPTCHYSRSMRAFGYWKRGVFFHCPY